MKRRHSALHIFAMLLFAAMFLKSMLVSRTAWAQVPEDWFEIQVIDRETRRGVPMVELVTVHDVVHITDNAGRIALYAPERAGEQMYFSIRSPGYKFPPDGFGYEGIRLTIKPGSSTVVEIDRLNAAERLYRITGQDLYVDSVRLGHDVPIRNPLGSALVAGQDSVQVASYRDRLYWFWGDTNRLSYPLGLFRTAGATSAAADASQWKIAEGIDFDYFTDNNGFTRAMVNVPAREGVVWIDGVCTVPDDQGVERLVAHYSRRPGLADQLEHGLLIFNDERQIFEVLQVLDLNESWRFIRDHPVRVTQDEKDYLQFGNPFPVTRVPATLAAIQDPAAYESFCRNTPVRNSAATAEWSWKQQEPTTQKNEHRWLRAGLIQADATRFVPLSRSLLETDQPAEQPVLLHSGTVFFNAWRNRWIMIAVASGTTADSPSFLGEVWYAEAQSPQGPFSRAVKIATHPGQTFYNPCHHPFFDADGGRIIYFEGTYCNTFTKSPPTPRYNYNQLMYRLDLSRIAE